MSPALAGGFLTTGPPEKSNTFIFVTMKTGESTEAHLWDVVAYGLSECLGCITCSCVPSGALVTSGG